MILEKNLNAGENLKQEDLQKYFLLDCLNMPACVLNLDGNLIYSNKSFSDFFPEGKMDFRLDFEHPFFSEYRKKVAQCYLSAKNGHSKQCFAMINSSEGSHLPVEVFFFPIFDGNAQTGIASVINVVDPKSASIEKSGSRLIFESKLDYDDIYYEFSPMNIIRLNEKYEIIKQSRTIESSLGYTSEELTKNAEQACRIIFPLETEKILKAAAEIFMGNMPFQRLGEIRVSTKNSEIMFVNVVMFPVRTAGDVKAVDIIMEDITKLKNIEDKINSMQRLQLMGDITMGFLHSLNNTLNVILSKSQLLMQISEKEAVSDGIRLIEESSMSIFNQIRRIQNFIGDNISVSAEKTEPFVSIIEDAIEFAKLKLKVEDRESKRTINIERKYYIDFNITADTKSFREIIISMILKVSAVISKKGTINISTKENADVYLIVSAEKDIIPESTVVFEEALNVFSGLNIRQVADKLGIKILEEESPTSYSMKAIIPKRFASKKSLNDSKSPEFKIRGFNIMIVEDEKYLRDILFELFDKMGNRVSVFENGKDALKAYMENPFDLVITDYDIEGITGIELAAKIKDLDDNTSTILLSGWMLNNLETYHNIIDIFIPKPFKLDELILQISKIMSDKKIKKNSQKQ